ncbi:MAG: CRTAC1 family protein [Deltaproteobacteria bacterium]|nr:MAG: CRTAC1 family protein [Deltaproteobacteria bacterium]
MARSKTATPGRGRCREMTQPALRKFTVDFGVDLDEGGVILLRHSIMLLILMLFSVNNALGQISFQDVSTSAGITHSGETWGGGSWGDFNGDGYPDLWVGNHNHQPSFYINQGDGTFVEQLSTLVPGFRNEDTHGAEWADFDNDGDQDLVEFVGAKQGRGTGPNRLYVNQGGILVDQAPMFGVDDIYARGRTPLWFDWNRDGRLDLLVTTLPTVNASPELFTQHADGLFYPTLNGNIQVANGQYAQMSDLTGDGKLDIVVHSLGPFPAQVFDLLPPAHDALPGLNIPITPSVRDSVIADLTGDGLPDIYMVRRLNKKDAAMIDPYTVHASLSANGNSQGFSFQAAQPVTFELSAVRTATTDVYVGSSGWHPSAGGPLILSASDPMNQGLFPFTPGVDYGVFIGYDIGTQTWQFHISSPTNYYVVARATCSSQITNLTPIGFSPTPQNPDRLLVKSGNGWVDQPIGYALYGKSVVAADFDNDMDLDLYVVTGAGASNEPNYLLENLGGGTFQLVPNAGGAAGSMHGSGDSVSTADYDRDGRMDLFVTNGDGMQLITANGPHQLFHNTTVNQNHWLEIDLKGTRANPDGIGAHVMLTAGGVTQVREQSGGMHRFSQNDKRLHFGLGPNTVVNEIVIRWNKGRVQTIRNIPADQIITVVQP